MDVGQNSYYNNHPDFYSWIKPQLLWSFHFPNCMAPFTVQLRPYSLYKSITPLCFFFGTYNNFDKQLK